MANQSLHPTLPTLRPKRVSFSLAYRIEYCMKTFWLFVCLTFAGCKCPSESDRNFVEKSPVEKDVSFPSTYEEAVSYLLNDLTDEDKDLLRATPKSELIDCHFGWGMGIRDNLGLWGHNNKLLKSCANHVGKKEIHPDDASMILIEGVWGKLQDERP